MFSQDIIDLYEAVVNRSQDALQLLNSADSFPRGSSTHLYGMWCTSNRSVPVATTSCLRPVGIDFPIVNVAIGAPSVIHSLVVEFETFVDDVSGNVTFDYEIRRVCTVNSGNKLNNASVRFFDPIYPRDIECLELIARSVR